MTRKRSGHFWSVSMDWVKGKPTEEHGLCPEISEIQSFPVDFLFIHLHPSLGIGILVV